MCAEHVHFSECEETVYLLYNQSRKSHYQKENEANKSDDQLFATMIRNDKRYLDLKEFLQSAAYETGYMQLYQDAAKEVVQASLDLTAAENSTTGIPGDSPLSDKEVENRKYKEIH